MKLPIPLNANGRTRHNGAFWIEDGKLTDEAVYWPYHVRWSLHDWCLDLELRRQDCELYFTVRWEQRDEAYPEREFYTSYGLLSWDFKSGRPPIAKHPEPELCGALWRLLNPLLLASILYRFWTR